MDEAASLVDGTLPVAAGHGPVDVLVVLLPEMYVVAILVFELEISLLDEGICLLDGPSHLLCKFKVLYGRGMMPDGQEIRCE